MLVTVSPNRWRSPYQQTCLPSHDAPCALEASPLEPEKHPERQHIPGGLHWRPGTTLTRNRQHGQYSTQLTVSVYSALKRATIWWGRPMPSRSCHRAVRSTLVPRKLAYWPVAYIFHFVVNSKHNSEYLQRLENCQHDREDIADAVGVSPLR